MTAVAGRPGHPGALEGTGKEKGQLAQKIGKVEVHLVVSPVPAGYGDATRKVENVGFVIVRVTTDQGLEGVGITYNEVGGLATKALIDNDMTPRLLNRDPLETEVIWQDFAQYMRGVARKGLMYCALSAVDIALWDLKGKIFGLPLYRLLGGDRAKVPVYASGGWTSYSDDELVEEMVNLVHQGYTMMKFKVGVDGGNNPGRDLERVRKVREAVGPATRLMLDANNCWDAATAVQFANRVKEFDILFLEEPVPADDIPGLARYKRGTDLPLATGEHEYTKFGVRDLVLNEAADVVQVDGTRVGGYTELLKVAAITQAWHLKLAPHAMEYVHSHFVSATPNSLFLERLLIFEELSANVFKYVPLPKDGYLEIPDLPGLGLDLNVDFLRER
jgi:L-alanine-DL-glutamate epimerase-like enolase superfamily enzyme